MMPKPQVAEDRGQWVHDEGLELTDNGIYAHRVLVALEGPACHIIRDMAVYVPL